jgi:hypothetical protein
MNVREALTTTKERGMETEQPRTIGSAASADATAVVRTRLPIMGVPVVFESDSPQVLETVESALGGWRLLDYRRALIARLERPPHIRLVLGPEDSTSADVAVKSPAPERLEVDGPGVRGRADGGSLSAECTLAPSLLHDRYRFEEHVLTPLTLFLVTRCDRQPLHAAAIARNGAVTLLAGPSGTGKSSLAYAALRSGWSALADDAVYLETTPFAHVWTRPARLHLPADARAHFPELADRALVRRENGKMKIPVDLPGTWPAALSPFERATLCLIQRADGDASAEATDAATVIGAIVGGLDPGFDVFRSTLAPALRAVVHERAWIVRTGPDPLHTIAVLDELESR